MKTLLTALCQPFAVSGDERTAASAAQALLAPLGAVELSPLGNVYCRLPAKKAGLPRVLLTAHLDRIGLMVTRITKQGFLKVAPCGGVDRRAVAGARVTVHTATGPLAGIVCATPPHLSDGKGLPQKVEESAVDVGFSYAQAVEKISCGDRITFDGALISLLGETVCSSALDNRAGCAAVIAAAQKLAQCETAEISISLCAQEETGGGGAKTSAVALAPDFAFVVDVSMAHTPDSREELCGLLHGGPMIGYAPALDRALSAALGQTAKSNGIPFQQEVMAGSTGTDADAIAVSGIGVRTALLSIPLRYMHTPCEMISLTDLEQVANLIALQVGGDLCSIN